MTMLPAFLDDALNQKFLTHLLSQPQGRASLLAQLAEAEGGDGGELDIFEHVMAVLDDDEVMKLVRVHKEDEERHERLFADKSKEQGAAPIKLPKDAQLLRRLDAHTGFFTKPVTDRAGVVEAYLLLLVIEERAIRQFGKMRRAFLAVGANDVVELLDTIAKDEERHLRYCEAISKRYASDEVQRQTRLGELRALEQQCFEEVQALNLQAYVASGLMDGSMWSPLWRMLNKVAHKRVHALPHAAPLAAAA
jgi:rubrerythrin